MKCGEKANSIRVYDRVPSQRAERKKSGEAKVLRIAVIDDYMHVVASAVDWSRLDPIGTVNFFHDHLTDAELETTPFTATLRGAAVPR